MIHLPWILCVIGGIGYYLYDEQILPDDWVFLISIPTAVVGIVSSVCIYPSKLINYLFL